MDTIAVFDPLSLELPMAGLALGWAAADDLCRRIIPDTASILLATLGLALPLWQGAPFPWVSLAAAATLFVVLCVLYGRGWLGGGDVKLASAILLLVGVERAAPFATATALAGGMLSLLYLTGWLALRNARPARRLLRRFGGRPGPARILAHLLAAEAHRIATRHSVPYGVALAAGGLLTLSNPTGGAAWF
ncbi:prepilin peptidase CpaA [Azospirillum baldaniorum]|uniref:A24 family peptidase n=1 Tax=Azospirillum baldaniorum TaxID=1064539 RepID=UPI0011A4EF8B|nr:A24 family peptidase [Azospirillum baldaniorum]TWA57827.1 prepilin peptidase CpaA [Azospirillum baldaniorum]